MPTYWNQCILASYSVDILHIDEDQRPTSAVLTVGKGATASAGRRLNTQGSTGTDEDSVTQHPVAAGERAEGGNELH